MNRQWYIVKSEGLDYSVPIMAERDNPEYKEKYLLISQIDMDFKIKGYNWFNLYNGTYNSCSCWTTPEEAVKTYRESGYSIYNAVIKCDRLY